MGATKKMCTFILKIENGAKSDLISYSNYSKTNHTEIQEMIILRVFLIKN